MTEKQMIIDIMTPKAVLKAITPEASKSIPVNLMEQDMVRITKFPFSVGRESRIQEIDGKLVTIEREKPHDWAPSNDLYLTDIGKPLQISREHFRIEKSGSDYVLIDRCSACGTTVKSSSIGGRDSGGEIKLEDGDIIAVGDQDTPYFFKFITLEE